MQKAQIQITTMSWTCLVTKVYTNARSPYWFPLLFSGSLTKLGACVNRYWQQKKAMAPGCEPAAVRTMMDALQPIALGQSLAGAGGGGFLFILTQDAQQEDNLRQILKSTQVREQERVKRKK